MNCIVCVDKNWGIGKNNDLLFKIKEDMAFFRQKTMGKTVVMGLNTLLSFPGSQPLKNRTNIVLTSSPREGVITVKNLDELFAAAAEFDSDDVFVIGGGSVYRQLLPYCSKAYVTKVDADGQAEVFFDNLDAKPEWRETDKGDVFVADGYNIRFTVYENEAPLVYGGKK